MRAAGAALSLLSCAALLTACGTRSAVQGSEPAPSITLGTGLAAQQMLTRSLDDAPSSLDPPLQQDVGSQYVDDDLFEGLTTLGPDGKAVPGVASSWDISPDGLTWVFHLRPAARWSNGEPLTARDFVYAWRRTVDPKTGAAYAQGLAPIVNGLEIATGKRPTSELGVEAIDEHTLRVHLRAPTPYLPFLMTDSWMFPIYEPVVRRYGDDWTRPEHIVSNGPFTLKEHVLGSRLTLTRNPLYWDAAHVKLQQVIYYVIEDRDSQARRYLAGQVQYVNTFPTTDGPWLRQQLGDQVVVAPYFGTFMLAGNSLRGPFATNRALRMALTIAIDRDMIAQHVLYGAGFPAYTLMPPLDGYTSPVPDWAKLPTAQRHELARRYYQQAGYSDKHPLRAELSVPAADPVTELTYEAVVGVWREVLGAQVSLHPEEFKILLQDNRLHKNVLMHNAWIGDYPDPYTFLQLYVTGFELNYGAYSNPQFDALLQKASAEPDNAQRYRLYEQCERLLNDDVAYMPIYYYAVRHLVKPYVKGWQPNEFDRSLSRYMYILEHQGS